MSDKVALGRSVMVVDDSGVFGFTLSLEFRKHGWDVFCCGTGTEALTRLREKHYDLILADVFMPGLRGDELASQVLKEFPEQKIIVMSSSPRESLPPLPKKVAFIPKPVDVAMVLNAFERASRATTGPIPAPPGAVPPPPPPAKP